MMKRSMISNDPNSFLLASGDTEDIGLSKPIVKIAKKVISILGFIFSIDS